LIEEQTTPHMRLYKKRLAEELTVFVHSKRIGKAIKASAILWKCCEDLKQLDEATFLEVLMECLKLK
jgi:tyrosyl-tRNA synthetase